MKRSASQSRQNSRWLFSVAILLVMFVGCLTKASANTIYVTTTEQKISSTGGCSLQEAIYSANFHNNIAIDNTKVLLDIGTATLKGTTDGATDTNSAGEHFIRTQCVAGSGNDVIVLPLGALLQMSAATEADPSLFGGFLFVLVGNAHNPLGPTATPLIFSTITIEANGSILEHIPNGVDFRAFAVGQASIDVPPDFGGGTVSGTGHLTIRNAYIRGFTYKGGDGTDGGGGGMGAGGAIYVAGGSLLVENSTFERNGAFGGNGGSAPNGEGGGGGGLGGKGGGAGNEDDAAFQCNGMTGGGGGGGGSRGSGSKACGAGGAGGGTITNGAGIANGYMCGGPPGDTYGSFGPTGQPGFAATCPGGGGGGGEEAAATSGNGGNGLYGGGGGGGASGGGNGGDGGFGGGGGGGWTGAFGGTTGGKGGFGGGGGAAADGYVTGGGHPGGSVMFGGNGGSHNGGGGGALGGAIFNDGGNVVIRNSTFYNNLVNRGVGVPDNGADAGGAIFSRNGSLTLINDTISGNQGSGSGAGIVVVEEGDGASASFILQDTIVANNGDQECFLRGSVTTDGSADNLVMLNGGGGPLFEPCPAVLSSADPLLGSLQNNGGFPVTPTMAIPKASPAWNAGGDTLLGSDQRGQSRPAMGGFDIGAFELCLDQLGNPCVISVGNTEPEPLTIQISPSGTGSTTPAPGNYSEPENSVVVLQATANLGYHFLNWTGGVTVSTNPSTTVIMDQPRTVTANFAQRDFSISPIASITISVDGKGSRIVTVNSLGDFSQAVNLSSSGQPPGVTATLSSPSVIPAIGKSIDSTLKLEIGPSVTPQTFTLTVTGSSGALTHSVTVDVTVQATTDGITQEIGTDVGLLCIDTGIANSLTSKLAAAQAFINSGDIQSAINTLTALLNELYAQAGKHIKSSCTDKSTNQTFDADAVLIAQVKALLASLGANLKPNPVMGYAVNSSNLGVAGATVSVVNSAKSVVASATTDAAGFYFFAKTSVFTIGATYTLKVTPPKPYKSATSSTFNWQRIAVSLPNSVVN